ncbi:cation:proton antiporter subunit C [Chloroflexota bacterium]
MDLFGNYTYFMIVILLVIGLYGMLAKRNLVKKLIGMNIFQTAIFLFYIEGATKMGGTVPVIDPALGNNPVAYINPLPHVLILTSIVVGISITGVALAFIIYIRNHYHFLDEELIMKEMRK